MTKAGKGKEYLDDFFKELVTLAPMAGTSRLLTIFNQLAGTRGYVMGHPLPITYLEIKAYCDLMEEQLTLWELDTIKAMDIIELQERAKLVREAG